MENSQGLEWFAPSTASSQQPDIGIGRQAGTGAWFMSSPAYKDWSNGCTPTLLYPGIPGAGKTIITSLVVDTLKKPHEASDDFLVAHIYLNHKRQGEQDVMNLMSNIVGQLL